MRGRSWQSARSFSVALDNLDNTWLTKWQQEDSKRVEDATRAVCDISVNFFGPGLLRKHCNALLVKEYGSVRLGRHYSVAQGILPS